MVSVFAGACFAVVALECGLGMVVLCQRDLLDAAAEDFEATGGLLVVLDWAEAHSIVSGICAVALLLAQVCSFFVTAGLAVDLLSERKAAQEAVEERWSAAPSLEKEGHGALLADLRSVHGAGKGFGNYGDAASASLHQPLLAARAARMPPRWLDVALTSAFLYMAAAGLLLLLVSAKLMTPAPDEAGGDGDATSGLRHGHHHRRRHRHKRYVPAGGGAPDDGGERAPLWFAGVVGVSGATMLAAGGMAAGGAWWGVAGLLHLFAGADSVLLAAQAFVLHMYCQHWRLLDAAAEFDDSNGLRTALGILDAHPGPLRAAAALLGVGQAACIAAAANYGTGTPLAARAKTAGYWAREKCGAGAAAASAAAAATAAAARARLARLPAREELLAALSSRFSSSSGGSAPPEAGSSGGPQSNSVVMWQSAASEADSDAGSGGDSLAGGRAAAEAPVLYAAFGGTPWAAKPRMLAPSPPASPRGGRAMVVPVRWVVREGHLPY
ncbi:hypothetical protein WJX81_003483 [Elliptochloris bilobata]|uniref:Protein S-acyltransferase n=1 Tax=Elliptochloris bilobata TaxID=381761 RepID=A0AAW1RFL3_9CHLO